MMKCLTISFKWLVYCCDFIFKIRSALLWEGGNLGLL